MTKSRTMRSFREFLSDDSGATAIEYALIASGIAGVLIAVVMGSGTQLQVSTKTFPTALTDDCIRAAAFRRPEFPACRAHRRAAARPSRV
jgi:pilus assembly protein Flp/PilA